MRQLLVRLIPLTAGALLLAACDPRAPRDGAADGDTGGTLVISVPTDPGMLLPPFVVTIQGKEVSDLLYDRLVEIGPELGTFGDAGFLPRLAERWTWGADSLSVAFHLDPRARWHDGRPVRAEDVRFTFALATDTTAGASNSSQLSAIDSVSTPDSLTAVFWFARRYPEQFFDATFHTPILPAHQLRDLPRATLMSSEAARNPVGSGPYRIARYLPGQVMELVADSAYYRGRAKLDRVLISISPDPTTAATRLFAGEADVFEALRPDQMAEMAKHEELRVAVVPGMGYTFLQLNLRDPANPSRPHPLFGERELRRALTRAVNRPALVQNVWDSLASVGLGPFTRLQASADTTIAQLPYDVAAAAHTLDSLGWRDTNADGVRERGGVPLAFRILVPSSSMVRQRAAVVLQEQLAQVGARVAVERLDMNATMTQVSQRRFDTFVGTWITDPGPAGVRETWGGASARRKGGLNFGAYESAVFDAAVDSGLAARDLAERRRMFRRAYETIVQDAPAIWLFEPKSVMGVHRRYSAPPLRAWGWWTDIPEWSVPADRRIDRDRAVAQAAAPAAATP